MRVNGEEPPDKPTPSTPQTPQTPQTPPDDYIPDVFCPFSTDGRCPANPKCTNPRERICVNGFLGEDE